MRITGPLARAAARRAAGEDLWDDDRFRRAREDDLAQPTTSIRVVLVATVVCLVMTMLLTSGKLVEIAERQPLGSSRDRWLDLARGVDRVANFISLNRPYDLIQDIRGAGDDPGRRIDSIDEVARQAGVEPPPDPPVVTSGPPPTTVPEPPATTGSTSSTTTTTTTVAPTLRVVTATHPLRVHVVGDSQAEFLGQAITTESDHRRLDVTVDHQISTSLARPDYFNWPAELADVVDREDPEALVVFLGANEYQDMAAPDGSRLVRGSDEWRAEWVRRLAITLDVVVADHRLVVWVGQPPMRNDRVDTGVALVNSLAEPVVERTQGGAFVDIWDLFGGDGGFREVVVGPDGDQVRARVDDGIHITRSASSWVADLIFAEMDSRWVFPGP